MKVAKAKGRLRGKQPKLTTKHGRHLLELIDAGTHSTAELAELLSVGRSTVYRTVRRLPHYQSSPRGRSLIPQSPDAEPATRIRWPSQRGGSPVIARPILPYQNHQLLVGQDRCHAHIASI
jgi:Helix-turn-helix domain of resolvase